MSRRDAPARRRVLRRILSRLAEPAYADVRGLFRHAALLPEYHFSTLTWLLKMPEGRSLITTAVVVAIADSRASRIANFDAEGPVLATQAEYHALFYLSRACHLAQLPA